MSDCEYFGHGQDCEAALEPGENGQVFQPPRVKEAMLFHSWLKSVSVYVFARASVSSLLRFCFSLRRVRVSCRGFMKATATCFHCLSVTRGPISNFPQSPCDGCVLLTRPKGIQAFCIKTDKLASLAAVATVMN